MDERILFMIINGEIKFVKANTMDHREWFKSLGGNDSDYYNLIRGYIINNNLIFVKGHNLGYDDEVISVARKVGPLIKQQLNREDLVICCGVNPGENSDKWEPIMIIKDDDAVGKEHLGMRVYDEKNNQIIDFINNHDDPKFVNYAIKFTLLLLIISIITKIILVNKGTLLLSSRWNQLVVFAQIISLILSILSYSKKSKYYKYLGIIACAAHFCLLDLPDIIIGVLNLFFIVDASYIINLMNIISKVFKRK